MSEPLSTSTDNLNPEAGTETPTTAGGMLRQARQARGLHIAALATSIKVTPHKLELLEANRIDELPGAAFTRALAQTVCRTLKIDAGPVLALLPSSVDKGLERMSRGLNEPFRDRPGRQLPTDFSFLKNPVRLGALALIMLAAAVYVLPSNWIGDHLRFGSATSSSVSGEQPVPATIVTETVGEASMPAPVSDGIVPTAMDTVHPASTEPAAKPSAASAPVAAASVASLAAVAPATGGALQLHATSASWVQVFDRHGAAVFSRMLQAGETVALDEVSPLRLKIGNANAVQVTYKGERVDLAPVTTRGNVAKLELK